MKPCWERSASFTGRENVTACKIAFAQNKRQYKAFEYSLERPIFKQASLILRWVCLGENRGKWNDLSLFFRINEVLFRKKKMTSLWPKTWISASLTFRADICKFLLSWTFPLNFWYSDCLVELNLSLKRSSQCLESTICGRYAKFH